MEIFEMLSDFWVLSDFWRFVLVIGIPIVISIVVFLPIADIEERIEEDDDEDEQTEKGKMLDKLKKTDGKQNHMASTCRQCGAPLSDTICSYCGSRN